MEKLTSHRTLKNIIDKYGFHFTKSLGQNFLVDENILQKIVDSAEIKEDDIVMEIGTGVGTLTRALAERAAKVIAVEIDKKLIPILQETLAGQDNVVIINEDILKVNLTEILESHGQGKKIKVVANLPYYITTPIIMRFLEEGIPMESMTIMVQKEVADRLNARPSTKDYGSLTIAVKYYCDTEIVTKVPKGAFVPSPAVDSSVIRLQVKQQKSMELMDERLFFEVVRGSFSKRRKTLFNALSSYGSLGGKKEAQEALRLAEIDPIRRGETLDIQEFARLANAYTQVLQH